MTLFKKINSVWKKLFGDVNSAESISEFERTATDLIDQGNALEEQGDIERAMELYERAIVAAPKLARGYLNRGNILLTRGRNTEALAAYSYAAVLSPNYPAAHFNIGNVQLELGRLEAALMSYQTAVALQPDFVDAYIAQGNVLGDLKRYREAVIIYEKALTLAPHFAEIHGNLAATLKDSGELQKAVIHYQKMIEIAPDNLRAYGNLADVFRELGLVDEAINACRAVLAKQPDFVEAYTQLLFCLCHSGSISKSALYAEHMRFGEQFETPFLSNWPIHKNKKDPHKQLKVGFVSADLRAHAVSFFVEPILRILADSASLLLVAYYNHETEDVVTVRIKKMFSKWQTIVGLNDEEVAARIQEDEIDILIDLSGHTAKHRLLTFIRKPAPIQLSWVGYPGTTGLKAMDYYVAGKNFLPPFKLDDQFSEKIVQLPVTVTFSPIFDSANVNQLPALNNGYVTFGSFNRLDKIGRSVVALWAKLLRELPSAKMLLAGLPENGDYLHLVSWFEQEGISKDRLEFYHRSNMYRYLELHNKVDICLDTFPYTGGTTTNHALWMGVPTLTLIGQTPAGRQSTANLSDVGLIKQFGAESASEFIQKGLIITSDLAKLSIIRKELRSRFLAAPFSRTEIFAHGFEFMLRVMWTRWCEGAEVSSFELIEKDGHYSVR